MPIPFRRRASITYKICFIRKIREIIGIFRSKKSFYAKVFLDWDVLLLTINIIHIPFLKFMIIILNCLSHVISR